MHTDEQSSKSPSIRAVGVLSPYTNIRNGQDGCTTFSKRQQSQPNGCQVENSHATGNHVFNLTVVPSSQESILGFHDQWRLDVGARIIS